jgi:Ser/Thr protein kinase RdoA (MazF antagonist)
MTLPSDQRPPEPPRPQIAPASGAESHRERFDSHEMALVLSHFDLGVIEQLRIFQRGSRRSPKLRIKSQRGEYLLKRRAAGQDDPFRVAFAHDLQLFLAARGFPVPGLIGTRGENNSMLQLNGRVYELFHYVHGTRYDKSVPQAEVAGQTLGTLHRLLADFLPQYSPPPGSFHGAADMEAKLSLVPGAIAALEPQGDRQRILACCDFLKQVYRDAAGRVDAAGFRSWTRTVLHGDWHPGNLIFQNAVVVGVLDFDSSRMEPRAAEIANGLLQFSLRMESPEQPQTWPDGLDVNLIRALARGYDQTAARPIGRDERRALPWLMIEAMIAETVVPIAATGSFARIAGSVFVSMVERKVRWIAEHADHLL